MNIFQYYLDENHLKPGTKLKKGDEELKVVKPVGDDKYLVKEEDLDEANLPKWEVSYDYGPHMSTSEEVSAKTKEDAAKKVIAAAKKKGLHPMLNYVRSVGVKEDVEITEAKVGDSVWVKHPTDKWKTLTGRVKAIHSNDQVTVTHRDGSTKTYPKTSVSTDYESLHANPYKKPVATESAEQIDELSKTTLSGYVAKASSSKMWHQDNAKYARQDQQDDIADEEEAKANKRKAGIKRAISKITKEAVELVDESPRSEYSANMSMSSSHPTNSKKYRLIHKKTGATRGVFDSHSSAKAALADHPLKKHLVIEEITLEEFDQLTELNKDTHMSYATVAGLARLAKRVAEAKQLDELKSDTLRSYADKRMDQVKDRYKELMSKTRTNKEVSDYNKDTKKDLENINKARDKAAYKRQGSRVDRDGD